MRFLLAGGAGEVGRGVSKFLLGRGHAVAVLDRAAWPAAESGSERLTLIRGDLRDKSLVTDAVREADVVVNLAWSFSDDAATIFREDICGHVNLLEAAAANPVKRFIYASTAAVYGSPQAEPVTEDHPCLVASARKPLYALGKYTAEELCHIYRKNTGMPVAVLRFWWAFGDTVGGRHMREMIGAALKGEQLSVAAGAGGAFVAMADLAQFILAAAEMPPAAGGVYNLGSLFLTWPEIAAAIIETVGSPSALAEVPARDWTGPAFMNERWRLSWAKAAAAGYRPGAEETLRPAFRQALAGTVGRLRQEHPHG